MQQNHRKGYPQLPRPLNPSGSKPNFPFIDTTQSFYPYNIKRGDVGAYTGGSTGATRLPVLPHPFQPGPTHPNPASQASVQQGHHHPRSQAPLPPHIPHSSSGPPPPSVPQTHLHLNHNTLAQHPQHHQAIPGPGVSVPAGIANTLPQGATVTAVLPPGTSPGTQGPHDINVQAIQNSNGQLSQGSIPGVPMTPGHAIMYPPNTQTPQPQGPPQNSQGPYYQQHPGHQNVPHHIHTNQQRQITAMQHQNFSYVLHSPQNYPVIQSPAFQLGQAPRHAPSNGQHTYVHQQPFYQTHMPVYYPAMQQAQVKPPVTQPTPKKKSILVVKDPTSGDIIDLHARNDDSSSQKGPSPQQSRESSARNTPAPRDAPSNAVAAEFAQKVASAAASDKADEIASDIVDSSNGRTNEEKETCSVTLEISESRDKNLIKLDNRVEFVSQSQINDSASCVPEFNITQTSQPHLPATVHQPISQPVPPQHEAFIQPQQSPPIILHAHQKQAPPYIPPPQVKQPSPAPAPAPTQEKGSSEQTPSPPPLPPPPPPPNSSLQRQPVPAPAAVAPPMHHKHPSLPKQVPAYMPKQQQTPPQPSPPSQQVQQMTPHSQQKVPSNAAVPTTVQARPQTLPNQKLQQLPTQSKQASPPPDPRQFPPQVQVKPQAPQQTQPALAPAISKPHHVTPKQPQTQPQQTHPAHKQQQSQQSKQQHQPPVPAKLPQQTPQPKQPPVPIQPKQQPQQPTLNQSVPQLKQIQVSNQAKAPPTQKQVPPNMTQGTGKPIPNIMPPTQQRAAKQKATNQATFTPAAAQETQQAKPTNNQPSTKALQVSQQPAKFAEDAVKGSGSQPKAPVGVPNKVSQDVAATSDNDGMLETNATFDMQKSQTNEKSNEKVPPSSMQMASDSQMDQQVPSITKPIAGASSPITFESEPVPQAHVQQEMLTKIVPSQTKEQPPEVNSIEIIQSSISNKQLDSRESSEECVRSSSISADACHPAKEYEGPQNGIHGSPPHAVLQPSMEENTVVTEDTSCGVDKALSKVEPQISIDESSTSPVPEVKIESQEVSLNKAKSQDDEVDNFHEKQMEMPTSVKPDTAKTESSTNKDTLPTQEKPKEKLKYDRSFLLEFQKSALALKRPESLPNLEVVLDGPVNRAHERPPKMNTDFMPPYLQTGRGGRTMQFIPPKPFGGRNSQSGKRIQKVIDFSPSSNEAILKPTKNPWRPNSKAKEIIITDEKEKTDQIVMKVRGILNKLTPDNFNKLVNRVREISFDSFFQFDEVITLVFEKAVNEQGFSAMYAQLCQVLSSMSVKTEHGKEKADAKFKNLIISRCQQEFERDNSDNTELSKMAEELNQCTDPVKKPELKAHYDFEETKLRKTSVGNIRFIGELYKLKMLTSPIMMRIIGSLLDKKDEESLECLCKLLQTIGKSLDTSAQSSVKAQGDLNKHFKTMQDLVGSKLTSSRVRFLMMNVIDMKKNDWVPRREDAKPTKISQVHEDIKKEELEASQILNMPSRRDDKDRRRNRDNRMMDARPMMDDWTTVNHNNQRRSGFDSSRLMGISGNRMHSHDAPVLLRPNTNANMWGSGSSGGFKEPSIETRENRFSILQDGTSSYQHQEPRRPMNVGPRLAPGGNMGGSSGFNRPGYSSSKSMGAPPTEKPNLFNRNMHPSEHSKSSSRSSSRDSSLARETKTPPIIAPPTTTPQMTFDEANKHTVPIIEEYMGIKDKKEARACIEEKFTSASMHLFVQAILEWVLDKDTEKRKLVGHFLHHLLACGLLSAPHLISGSKPVIEMIEDFAIDIPQVTVYVGEILAPLLVDSTLPLQKMVEIFAPSGGKKAELMANLVKAFSNSMGSNIVSELWKESGLEWERILPLGSSVEDFLSKHSLDFLGSSNKSRENTQETLYHMFSKEVSIDVIFAWINQNVEDVTNKKFIRALVTALIESQVKISSDGSSISWDEFFETRVKSKLKAVIKYVDNVDSRELQCLYALQAISVKYQHPPGLLEKCFNAFYDGDAVCEDAFIVWFKSSDPEDQVGKGVCVASVHKFFNWLEAETEYADPAP